MNCREKDTDQKHRNEVGVSELQQSSGCYLHWICQFSQVDRSTTNPFVPSPWTDRAEERSRDETPP